MVRLTPAFAELLARTPGRGRRFVLVTPETSRLTVGLRSALVASHGVWFVTTAAGYRDGLTGVDHAGHGAAALDAALRAEIPDGGRSDDKGEAGSGAKAADEVETANGPGAILSSLREAAADEITAQLSIDVSTVHGRADSVGRVVETVAAAVGGGRARAWGTSEPLLRPWDVVVMTEEARLRGASASRFVVEGDGFSAAITARATRRGLEETVALTVDVPGGGADLDAAIARAQRALESLARATKVSFALVLARQGERDRSFRAVTYPPPNPVVLLIGTGAVERLDLHRGVFADEQDVRIVGGPAHPAFLLPLGDSRKSGWEALTDALDSVGTERLTALVGPPLLDAWEDDLQTGLDHHGEPHPHHTEPRGGGDAP